MYQRIAVAMLLALAAAAIPVQAQEESTIGVVEGERGSLESFFYSIWSRLQSLSPRAEEARVRTDVVATAGLRGADGDNLHMEPYWKGDLAGTRISSTRSRPTVARSTVAVMVISRRWRISSPSTVIATWRQTCALHWRSPGHGPVTAGPPAASSSGSSTAIPDTP